MGSITKQKTNWSVNCGGKTITFEIPLIEAINATETRKKIHDFHIVAVNKHMDELEKTNKTVCNSPFLRSLIYRELQAKKVRYSTKVVDWGRLYYHKDNRYNTNWKRALRNLRAGRFDPEHIKTRFYNEKEYTGYEPEEIQLLFTNEISMEKKIEMVKTICIMADKTYVKGHILNYPYKTIREITITPNYGREIKRAKN